MIPQNENRSESTPQSPNWASLGSPPDGSIQNPVDVRGARGMDQHGNPLSVPLGLEGNGALTPATSLLNALNGIAAAASSMGAAGDGSTVTTSSPLSTIGATSSPKATTTSGTVGAKTVSNLALTSNVATITATGHGFVVGQLLNVLMTSGPSGYADINGIRVVAGVTDVNNFTLDVVHVDIGTAGAGGSVKGLLSVTGSATLNITDGLIQSIT